MPVVKPTFLFGLPLVLVGSCIWIVVDICHGQVGLRKTSQARDPGIKKRNECVVSFIVFFDSCFLLEKRKWIRDAVCWWRPWQRKGPRSWRWVPWPMRCDLWRLGRGQLHTCIIVAIPLKIPLSISLWHYGLMEGHSPSSLVRAFLRALGGLAQIPVIRPWHVCSCDLFVEKGSIRSSNHNNHKKDKYDRNKEKRQQQQQEQQQQQQQQQQRQQQQQQQQ